MILLPDVCCLQVCGIWCRCSPTFVSLSWCPLPISSWSLRDLQDPKRWLNCMFKIYSCSICTVSNSWKRTIAFLDIGKTVLGFKPMSHIYIRCKGNLITEELDNWKMLDFFHHQAIHNSQGGGGRCLVLALSLTVTTAAESSLTMKVWIWTSPSATSWQPLPIRL